MQPLHPLKRKRPDYILEAISWTGLTTSFIPLLFYDSINQDIQIPIHYNLSGEADDWGNATVLWITPILAIVLHTILSIAERCYQKFNYPVKITADNAPYLYQAAVRLIRTLKALFAILFTYINNTSLAQAYGHTCTFSQYIIPAFTLSLLIAVSLFFLRNIQHKE